MTEELGPAAAHAARAAEFGRAADDLARRSRSVSNARGLAFLVFVTSAVGLATGWDGPAGLGLAAGLLAFIALVRFHAGVLEKEDHARRLQRVADDARMRADGSWVDLPARGDGLAPAEHPYAADLDLFGPASLFLRIGVARTRLGERALAAFLLTPATPDEIRARQASVGALAPLVDLRQRLEALALPALPPSSPSRPSAAPPALAPPPDPEPLLSWTEEPAGLSARPALRVVAWVLPLLTFAAFVASRLIPGLPPLYLLSLSAQILVVARCRRDADRVFGALSATPGAFLRQGPMLELVERELGSVPGRVAELHAALTTSQGTASGAMRRFERALGWFELRHSGLVHPFVDALLLWDLHCVLSLERWRAREGHHARRWFGVLAELEALSALASYAADEKGVSFPVVESGPPAFEAEGLAHALVPPSRRVANDVRIARPTGGVLVTGSNMSGKSTFLRAIGLAAVLAQAGAPVPARRLRMTPLEVRTSLRIADSLARGVSHFYAEVARLKAIVDAARAGRPVLYLLDEILHGTNSEERQIGARWVLGELVRSVAIGVVTTHDQGLCELPPGLSEAVSLAHFRETVAEGRMSFDYQLRPGPVAGGNALRLMRLVGLDVPLPGEAGPGPSGPPPADPDHLSR